MTLPRQIFIAIALAALCGSLTRPDSVLFGIEVVRAYALLGDLFIRALQMLVIPLILSALVASLVNIPDGHGLGRLGMKTLLYFVISTLVAVTVGVLLANLIQPGVINGQPAGPSLGLADNTEDVLAQIEATELTVEKLVLQLIPENLAGAAVDGQMLGLITFGLLFGYFLRQVPTADGGDTLRQFFNGLYHTMLRLTLFIIRFTPIGVFGLIAKTVTHTGFAALVPLGWFVLVVVSGLVLHGFVILPLVLKLTTGLSPWRHFRNLVPAMLTAFSTASSAATMPLTMEATEHRSGVSNRVTSFMIPLGTTINMNGTALYECVVVLFVAQALDIQLSILQQFIVLLTALVTSIGVAGIPAASLVAITLILGIVGLPVEAIGMVLVTDRLLDMCRTTINIWSDTVGAVMIARSEGETGLLQEPPQAGQD